MNMYFNEITKLWQEEPTNKLTVIHIHDFDFPCGDTGRCIKRCHESPNGELWVSDDYRGTQVNFCPACGYEAKKKWEHLCEQAKGTPE